MFALLLIPISGSIAFAVELGGIEYIQRSAQNAADAAALAAATNNSGTATTGTTALIEGRAAAKPYGYTDGVNGVTVTAGQATCPTGVAAGSTCYEAIVTSNFPLSFSRIIGFLGSSGSGTHLVKARAIAIAKGGGIGGLTNNVCVWTFTNLLTTGTPDAYLGGCSVRSDGNMRCTGGGLHADFSVAAGSITGNCAQPTTDPTDNDNNFAYNTGALPPDPYAALATPGNIPSVCGATTPPQLAKVKGSWEIPAANKSTNEIAAGTPGWSGTQRTFCGDVQLTGNVTLTGTSTLIIENGRLDLNGFTIATQSGAAATIVFSGNATSTAYQHYPTSLNGGGMIDIAAPKESSSSPWKGIAIYQDPHMTTTSVDFVYAGNSPAWKITGVVYLPKATVEFKGVVNKASNGEACIILMADDVTINGTGKIIGDVSSCAAAGITPPIVNVGTAIAVRERLVF